MLITALIAVSLLGCQEDDIPQGHYTGVELKRDSQGNIARTQVSANFEKQSNGSYSLIVTGSSPGEGIVLSGTKLDAPTVLKAPLDVARDGSCWESPENGDESAQICVTSDALAANFQDAAGNQIWSLNLKYSPVQAAPVFETPRSYTLSQAMSVAAQMSFDSRIEYEHVLQAKTNSKAAYLNLLPHLNSSDIFNNLTPSIASLGASIGDLAPFLLPTRWLQAKDAKIDAQIENDVSKLVHLSIMAQVEGLAYSLIRDQNVVAVYQQIVSRAQDAHDQVWKLEQQGTFPTGSAEHLQGVIAMMQLDLTALNDVLAADRAALSQSLGFFNPEAVSDVTLDSEPLPIDHAVALDEQQETTLAISRSLELDEMDRLSQVASDQKTATYFNWLDPAGDYTQDLGFNLGENLAVDSSQISELKVRKEQLESSIAQNLFSYVHSFNTPVAAWSATVSDVALQDERLAREFTYITPNSGLNTLDIEGVLQDCLNEGVRKEQTLAEYRTARANIDRALLQNAYSNVK